MEHQTGPIMLELPPAPQSIDRTWGVHISEEDMKWLALNIYFEARNDTMAGKIAVGQVVLNRAENANFPNTVRQVVQHARLPGLHRCQFSWYCDGKRDEPNLRNRFEEEAWYESQVAARIVAEGMFKDYIQATHYHAVTVYPEWANDLEFIRQVGLHRFYE
jgi:spore germination cell wall hydrolase CwlJ-like protein